MNVCVRVCGGRVGWGMLSADGVTCSRLVLLSHDMPLRRVTLLPQADALGPLKVSGLSQSGLGASADWRRDEEDADRRDRAAFR